MTNKAKISITYTWVVSPKEWSEATKHWEEVAKDVRIITHNDAVFAFYTMLDIGVPDATIEVTRTK